MAFTHYRSDSLMNISSDISEWFENKDLQELVSSIVLDHKIEGPRYVEFHLTDRCNSNCYFCNQKSLRKNNMDFVFADLKALLSQLVDHGLQAVRLSGGGDPTMYPDLKSLLELIKNYGLSVARFDTNGVQLTPDLSRLLINCGLGVLHISMQAPTKESWSKVTGHEPNDFDTLVENIREFIKMDKNRTVQVHASFIMDTPTHDKLIEMEKLCKDLDIEMYIHDLNSYQYSEHFTSYCVPRLNAQLSQARLSKENLNFLANFLRSFNQGNTKVMKEPLAKPLACYAPWIGTLIKSNGNVYPCCAIQGPIMGNIYKESFMDIWEGINYKIFRQLAKEAFFGISSETSPYIKKKYAQNFRNFYNYFPNYCVSANCPVKRSMFSIPKLDDEICRYVKLKGV